MATTSNIEWTDMTWNPVTGCVKVSQGCKHCYAERMAKRLKAMGAARYRHGFRPTLHDDLIDAPRQWKRPRLIFVNSMSDLFQEAVPDAFIRRVFDTMRECPQHSFQILTKRSDRLRQLGASLSWPPNVWMGVSVEDARVTGRIADLVAVPAHVRFLSCEGAVRGVGGIEGGVVSGC
jgi:protein gp37